MKAGYPGHCVCKYVECESYWFSKDREYFSKKFSLGGDKHCEPYCFLEKAENIIVKHVDSRIV